MDTDAVVASLDDRLRAVATPERAEHEKAYLKSDLVHLGASMPAIRKVAVAVGREHPDLTHDQLVALVDACWQRGVHELRMAAVELLVDHTALLGPDDTDWLVGLVRESHTWALVDPLAAQVLGAVVEAHPDAMDPRVRSWADDGDHWVRRTALLVHLLPLRRGGGDFERFGALADGMLEEREFFVRKAIGWVLRDRRRRRPDLVVGGSSPAWTGRPA